MSPVHATPALPYECAGPSPHPVYCTTDAYTILDDESPNDLATMEVDETGDNLCDAATARPSGIHGGIPAFAQAPTNVPAVPATWMKPHDIVCFGYGFAPGQPLDGFPTPACTEHANSPGSFTEELVQALHHLDRSGFQAASDDASEHLSAKHDMVGDAQGYSALTEDLKQPFSMTKDDGCHHHDCGAADDVNPAPMDTDDQGAATYQGTGHFVQLFPVDTLKPVFLRVLPDVTIGGITVAESSLGSIDQVPHLIRATDAVGTYLNIGSVTTPFQQIFLRNMTDPDSQLPAGLLPAVLKSSDRLTRIQGLHQQQAWVASDEMTHYLGVLCQTGEVSMVPPCLLPDHFEDEELQNLLHQWASQCCAMLQSNTRVISAILVHNHWFPVYCKAGITGLRFATTPGGQDWLDIALNDIPQAECSASFSVMTAFHNDCGFQVVAWLISVAFQPDWPTHTCVASVFTSDQALVWRSLYEHHLLVTGLGNQPIAAFSMSFGGAGFDLQTALANLLRDKGVPEEHLKQRTDTVIERLGRSRISQLLRGPNPWRDLKAAANTTNPRLQLVLTAELERAIQHKLKTNPEFGNKKAKKAPGTKKPSLPVPIRPADVTIPGGIFKEGADVGLSQLQLADIGPNARGVVVATVADAAPYLKVARPVSSGGLALLVLDAEQNMLMGVGNQIRFPAVCTQTQEPFLVTATLVQLGSVEVSRNVAAAAPKIDEVQNAVLKVLVFRDELTDVPWSDFIQQPAKHVIESTPEFNTNGAVLDCWDRQFLSIKMQRIRAIDAEVFCVSLRLTGIQFDPLLQRSGQNAMYFEPRSIDGRSHAPEFRVVWLNRQDKATATVARQATKEWACLVRSGVRFGLRVRLIDAQAVHQQHKPDQPFLEGDNMQTYNVGPMPYGATRATLAKVFQSWPWNAKATQPKGRSADGKGIVWEVISASSPPFGVYNMQHADVLISAVTKAVATKAKEPQVQASAKTLAALRAANADSEDGDPWEQKGQDPWATYQVGQPAKQARVQPSVPTASVEAMATRIEKQVLQSVQTQLDSHADAAMTEGPRVQELEDRLLQLELQVSSHHQQQQACNRELANQITHVEQKVDNQSQSIQDHFDRKLTEQLGHIEKLLLQGKAKE